MQGIHPLSAIRVCYESRKGFPASHLALLPCLSLRFPFPHRVSCWEKGAKTRERCTRLFSKTSCFSMILIIDFDFASVHALLNQGPVLLKSNELFYGSNPTATTKPIRSPGFFHEKINSTEVTSLINEKIKWLDWYSLKTLQLNGNSADKTIAIPKLSSNTSYSPGAGPISDNANNCMCYFSVQVNYWFKSLKGMKPEMCW